MIADGQPLPGERQRDPEPQAPMLPVEGHIVGAALDLQETRAKVDLALGLIRYMPRQDADIQQAYADAQQALSASWQAYSNYREVFACKGQG